MKKILSFFAIALMTVTASADYGIETLTMTNLKVYDLNELYGDELVQFRADEGGWWLAINIKSQYFTGYFTEADCDLENCCLIDKDGKEIPFEKAEITVTKDGDHYAMSAVVTDYDGIAYILILSYVEPKKSREGSVVVTDAVYWGFYDVIELSGWNAEGTIGLVIDGYIEGQGTEEEHFGLDTWSSKLMELNEHGDTINFEFIDGTAKSKSDDEGITITGKILFQNKFTRSDCPEYTFSISTKKQTTGIKDAMTDPEGEKVRINDRIYIQEGKKYLAVP